MQSAWGVLVVFLCLTSSLAAQYYESALTEQDLRRVLPVLKADRAGSERLAHQAAERDALERKRADARRDVTGRIAGGADPLEWLTKLTANAVAPSTGRYDAGCSRALSESSGNPSAVFSFGIAAPSSWLAVWKARDQGIPIGDRSDSAEKPGAQRPGATRAEALTQQTRSFYASRGFEYQGEAAPFEWQFRAPDGLVGTTVMGVNVLGRVAACRGLPSGPMVVVTAEGEAFARGPARPGPATNRELSEALDTAGLTEGQYLNLKLQLLNARADAQDPARLAAAAPAGEAQEKVVAIRRQNAEFYRQHAALLAPLLEGLQPDLEGME